VRLLVIDDSLTIRKLAEIAFKGRGIQVEFAATGTEGIACASASPPDLVLLDFVLPDMRGSDVCQRFSENALTREIPVVLMSAKPEAVLELAKTYVQVAGVLVKPFSPSALVERVEALLASTKGGAASRASQASEFTFAQKEQAALAIFHAFKSRLASIPEWIAEMRGEQPAKFFAKKILTPDMVSGLLAALDPLFRSRFEAKLTVPSPSPQPQREAGTLLEGHLGELPAVELLRLLASAARTGELVLGSDTDTLHCWFVRGQLVLVTGRDSDRYLGPDPPASIVGIPTATWQRAEKAQREQAKPIFVTLSEAGHIRTTDVAALVAKAGRRLLRESLDEMPVGAPFRFREVPIAPYAETYGSPIAISQLLLERMRRADGAKDELADDAVVARVDGFSRRIGSVELIAEEWQIAARVDGVSSVAAIADQCGLSRELARTVLGRLASLSLVTVRAAQPALPACRVLLRDPDVDGVHGPFRKLLSTRRNRAELVSVNDEADVVEAIRRERPVSVFLNGSGSDDLARVAKSVRGDGELQRTTLVVILDRPVAERRRALLAAGFDDVLVKPIAFSEIERFVVS
jgi:DNA-binding response OmpR family regulator